MGQIQGGTSVSDDPNLEFVLASLRVGSLRAKLLETEINSIGVALRGGLIDSYTAMQWVQDAGAMAFVRSVPPADDEPILGTSE